MGTLTCLHLQHLKKQTVMLSVICQIHIHILGSLSSISSSIGSGHMGQPSLPTCTSEPWPFMTLLLVYHCSSLLNDFWYTLAIKDQEHPSLEMTQLSRHHSLTFVKFTKIVTLAHFSASSSSNFEDKMFSCFLTYPTQ